jgi:Tol biopolymer transport system component
MKKKHKDGIITKQLQNSYMPMTTQQFKRLIFGVKSNPRRQTMKKRTAWFGVIGLLFTVVLWGSISQTGEDLFQKALRLERNEGKLAEAIELYNRVVAEGKNESLAAQAQLRIGLCYEKLGQKNAKQAQEAFQKVVDNFPAQSEVVRIAKEKISSLVRVQTASDNKELRERQLLSGPELFYDGWLGSVSPNGMYVSIVDWETNDLAIRDLTNGEKQRLTDQKNEVGFPLFSTWSPDGKRIVYDWWHDNSFIDLRVIGIEEKKPRTVYKNEGIEYAWPLDWFPDGEKILIAFSKDGTESESAVLSLKDNTIHVIGKKMEERSCISPDGRYIAYDVPQRESIPERDVFLYSLEERREMPLIKHPANDEILGWSPDGRWILFQSNRLGSKDAWIVSVIDGKVQGNPILVKRGKVDTPLGFSKDGSFYFMSSKQMENIYIASLDQETGEIQNPPTKMDLPYEGSNDFPAYSPDGKKLAYIRGSHGPALHIRSLESGKEKTFHLNMVDVALFPRWSPDGQAILLSGINEARLTGIYRIDVQTGEAKPVLLPNLSKKEEYRFSEWTPDGKSFFLIKREKGRSNDLICQYDFETEKIKKIHQTSHAYANISLSPDGKWLAFMGREVERELRIIPANGGEPQILCRFIQKGGEPILLSWTPDSQNILFFKKIEKTDTLGKTLCRIPVTGGEPQEMGLSMVDPDQPRVHPNGREIAFSSLGFSIPYPEYWVMENFLPKVESKK